MGHGLTQEEGGFKAVADPILHDNPGKAAGLDPAVRPKVLSVVRVTKSTQGARRAHAVG